MKIAYLLQQGVPDVRQQPLSGPALHVRHVCDELRRAGHSVRLLAVLDGRIWQSDDLATFTPVTVRALDGGPLRWGESAVRRVQSELKLPYAAFFEAAHYVAACRQVLAGYDLFYERQGWMGYGGALASRLMGVPLVLEVNGDHLSEYEMLGIAPQGVQRTVALKVMRWGAQQAAQVVATGEGWRQRFIDRWQVPPERIAVVENGSEVVDLLARDCLRAFRPPQRDEPLRVVYIGGFEPWHGLTNLVAALGQAADAGVPLQAELIGGGSEEALLRRMVQERGLEPVVTFAGFLPVAQYALRLAAADVGVAPYCGRVEYSGLKLLDYKAAGLVTLAAGANGQPAILAHGQSGWLVPPCDVDALAGALAHLAADRALVRAIGQQARGEAERLHSWRHTTAELVAIFDRVVAAHTRSGR